MKSTSGRSTFVSSMALSSSRVPGQTRFLVHWWFLPGLLPSFDRAAGLGVKSWTSYLRSNKSSRNSPIPQDIVFLKKNVIFSTQWLIHLQRYILLNRITSEGIFRFETLVACSVVSAITSFPSFSFSHINKLLAVSFAKRVFDQVM